MAKLLLHALQHRRPACSRDDQQEGLRTDLGEESTSRSRRSRKNQRGRLRQARARARAGGHPVSRRQGTRRSRLAARLRLGDRAPGRARSRPEPSSPSPSSPSRRASTNRPYPRFRWPYPHFGSNPTSPSNRLRCPARGRTEFGKRRQQLVTRLPSGGRSSIGTLRISIGSSEPCGGSAIEPEA